MNYTELDELCINTIRFLAVDAVQKAESGHPGLPLGSASMAYVLWDSFLRFNPKDPSWSNRDRFVLSAGHGSMLLYSLLYYRVLGLLTALSLVCSGAMVFAILVLLGRYINYTLDLAGIAGLIIGIGTTADSFVVFFERIKDEIREGRSFRSAVPRGWARARKTIVSGNAVTFLAAALLYFLAIGQVKGFAFTLGLTTILDLVVVFLVTWPLIFLASKSARLANPAYNGLGAVQQVARERRAVARAVTHSGAQSTRRG